MSCVPCLLIIRSQAHEVMKQIFPIPGQYNFSIAVIIQFQDILRAFVLHSRSAYFRSQCNQLATPSRSSFCFCHTLNLTDLARTTEVHNRFPTAPNFIVSDAFSTRVAHFTKWKLLSNRSPENISRYNSAASILYRTSTVTSHQLGLTYL